MRRFFVGLAILAMVVQSAPIVRADDRQIAQQIVQRLEAEKAKGKLHDFNIGLHVEEGAVYLTGYVASRAQERLALDAARKPVGVRQVFNEIEITESKPSKKSTENGSRSATKPISFSRRQNAEQAKPRTAAKQEQNGSDPATEIAAAKTSLAKSEGLSAFPLAAKAVAEKKQADKTETDPFNQQRLDQQLLGKPADKAEPADKQPTADNKPVGGTKLAALAEKPRPADKPESQRLLLQINKAVKHALASTKTRTENTASARRTSVEPAVSERKVEPTSKLVVKPASTTRESSLAEAKRIATEIIEKFRAEKQRGNLRKFGIDVEVDHGVVWLKGTVSSVEHQMLALDIARRVSGVTKVVNDLRVTGTAIAPQPNLVDQDEMIAQEVVGILQRYKEGGNLRGFGIDVQVDKGSVWLSGYVADTYQQDLVLEASRRVSGVQQVINDLTVRGGAGGQVPPNGYMPVQYAEPGSPQAPLAYAPAHPVNHQASVPGSSPAPMMGANGVGIAPARYDHPQMPGYAWPSYAAHPNYGAVTYPRQYSASAWPYIGPFYPYPQVPLGWRKVTLEWDDGWWHLDFKNRHHR